MADLDEIVRRFRALHDTQLARAPFSASLCDVIADQRDVASLLQAAPDEQQVPVLLLAALHDEVLRDPGCELAAWYPSVSDHPRTGDVGAALRRHCDRRRAEILDLVATRSTQTNEIGRCGLVLPALGLVADETGTLGLVDVGTSGGLNLLIDRCRYTYEPGGAVGPADSPVGLVVGTRGRVPVPIELPRIGRRIGLDREPVDIRDEASARWLRACVWPDQADRFHRLDAAIGIARLHPPEIRRADAVEGLASAVADVAEHGHPIVLNSWVLGYLTQDRRLAYVAELDRIGAGHDLSWVFAESPAQAVGLPFPEHLAGEHLTALILVRWRSGLRTTEYLGVGHPHGYWLQWADA